MSAAAAELLSAPDAVGTGEQVGVSLPGGEICVATVVAVVEDIGRVVEVEVVVAPVLALNPTRMARTPPFRNQRRTTQPQPMGGPRRMPE